MTVKRSNIPLSKLFVFFICLVVGGPCVLIWFFTVIVIPLFEKPKTSFVESSSPLTVTQLKNTSVGEKVLLEGKISERNPIKSSPFVAYYVEETRRNGSTSTRQRIHQTTPPLILDLADGVVNIEEGYTVELAKEADPNTKKFLGMDVVVGDSNYYGIRQGDVVTVVGYVKTVESVPSVKATFVAVGDRAFFVSEKGGALTQLQIFGWCFGISGMLIIILGGLLTWKLKTVQSD